MHDYAGTRRYRPWRTRAQAPGPAAYRIAADQHRWFCWRLGQPVVCSRHLRLHTQESRRRRVGEAERRKGWLLCWIGGIHGACDIDALPNWAPRTREHERAAGDWHSRGEKSSSSRGFPSVTYRSVMAGVCGRKQSCASAIAAKRGLGHSVVGLGCKRIQLRARGREGCCKQRIG